MLKRIMPISLGNGIRLHIIKTNKFKTNLVSIYLQRPLIPEEVTKNALLSMVLPRGTKTLSTSKEIAKTLEELYGASLGSDVSKKGERHILNFRMQLIHDKYVEEKNIFHKGMKLLNEFINYPYVEEDQFKQEYINQEKENLREKIEGRKNDKMRYAYDRCIEEMCRNENFALYEYGQLNDLENISSRSLYRHYHDIMHSSAIDICVVGDLEEAAVKESIVKNFQFHNKSIQEIKREKIDYAVDQVKVVTDQMDVSQGKLTLGFRTNIPFESKLYEPLIVYSNILGGGPNSKLFKNVREKESLCYYIFSRIEKFKSLMLISSGIEFSNYEKVVTLINKEIQEINKGHFTSEDIESAKNAIITSIRSMTDNLTMLADFYYAQVISNNYGSIEDIIEKIRKVDKDSIMEAARYIQLDTIYFLKNKEEGK